MLSPRTKFGYLPCMSTDSGQRAREAEAFTVVRGLDPLVQALATRLRDALAQPGGGRRRPQAVRDMVKRIDPPALAVAVLRGVLGRLLTLEKEPPRVQDLARGVGHAVMRAHVRVKYPTYSPRLAEPLIEGMLAMGTPVTAGQMLGMGYSAIRELLLWDPPLLQFYTPALLKSAKGPKRPDNSPRVSLAPDAVARYDLVAFLGLRGQRPMVEPPKVWSLTQRGGYRYALEDSVPLVRNVPANTADPACEAVVYEALNILQETAWRINPAVLAEARKRRTEGTLTPDRNTALEHAIGVPDKVAQEEAILAEAELDAEQPRLYFVHALDFRGRVYPTGNYLTPQGPDLARALLMFADGCTITRDDKPYIDALDAYGKECRDKKPWQYLAYQHERAALTAAHDRGEPYVNHLPIWQDASANGLQHMALLRRDERLAPAVNLVPGVKGNLYADMAARMTAHLQAAITQTEQWLQAPPTRSKRKLQASEKKLRNLRDLLDYCGGAISRDRAKGPTMTFGYGATRKGMLEAFVKDEEQEYVPWFRLLAYRFAEAAEAVLSTGVTARAVELREKLQEVARRISATKKPATWRVPGTDFDARQQHVFLPIVDRLTFTWEGHRYNLRTSVGFSTTFDEDDHVTSFAPNLIHSLDAAHLMLTVTNCARGIPLATVHDSFATWATFAPSLVTVFEMCFWLLYGNGRNPLADLWAQFQAQDTSKSIFSSDFPALPAQFGFDVDTVLESHHSLK
jgi:hypothetical protein